MDHDAATSAQAVSRLTAELVDVLDRLRLSVPRVPDGIDQLIARREERRRAWQSGAIA